MRKNRLILGAALAAAGALVALAVEPAAAQRRNIQPERRLLNISLGASFLQVMRQYGQPSEIQTVALSTESQALPSLAGGGIGSTAMAAAPGAGGVFAGGPGGGGGAGGPGGGYMAMMRGMAGGGGGPAGLPGGGVPYPGMAGAPGGGGGVFAGGPGGGGVFAGGPSGGPGARGPAGGGIPSLPPVGGGGGVFAGGPGGMSGGMAGGPGGGYMAMMRGMAGGGGMPGAGGGEQGGVFAGGPGGMMGAQAGGGGAAGGNMPEYSTAALFIYKRPNDIRYEFLINEDGRVAQISLAAPASQTGKAAAIPGGRTAKGVALGTPFSRVTDAYGYPERFRMLPGLRFYETYYTKSYRAAFTFDTVRNMSCVRITIALAD